MEVAVDVSCAKKWLKTAELYTRKEAAASRSHFGVSDVAASRQLLDTRQSLQEERCACEREIHARVSRLKRLVTNVKELVAAPLALSARRFDVS